MKINMIKDIDAFFKVVDKCKGNVEIVSNEGDRIVLKSKLCRFVLAAMAAKKDETLLDLEVKTEYPEDAVLLLDYMISQ